MRMEERNLAAWAWARLRPGVSSWGWAAAVALVLSVLLVEPSLAQVSGGTGDIATMLNNIVTLLTGPIAKALSIIALIIVAISWMFGAMDMRQAGGVIFGILVIASAQTIVGSLWGA